MEEEVLKIAGLEFNYHFDNWKEMVSIIKHKKKDCKDIYFVKYDDAVQILEKFFTNKEFEFLMTSNLLIAPAAMKHHANYKYGLFAHSYLVGLELMELTEKLNLSWDNKLSPMRIGLLHDICKTTDYIINQDDTIVANKESSYGGHGDKSIIILAGHIDLTEQEKLCIRYHMGAFTEKEEWGYYTRAVKKDINVMYTNVADMIASQIRGV